MGSKNRSGVVIKEVGLVNKWFNHSAEPNTNVNGLNEINISNNKGGPMPSRPPNPSPNPSSNEVSSETLTHSSDEIRAQKRLEEDEAIGAQSTAKDIEDIEIESESVGPSITQARV